MTIFFTNIHLIERKCVFVSCFKSCLCVTLTFVAMTWFVMVCITGVFPEDDPYTPTTQRLKLVTRHYEEMGEWFWRGHFVM